MVELVEERGSKVRQVWLWRWPGGCHETHLHSVHCLLHQSTIFPSELHNCRSAWEFLPEDISLDFLLHLFLLGFSVLAQFYQQEARPIVSCPSAMSSWNNEGLIGFWIILGTYEPLSCSVKEIYRTEFWFEIALNVVLMLEITLSDYLDMVSPHIISNPVFQ